MHNGMYTSTRLSVHCPEGMYTSHPHSRVRACSHRAVSTARFDTLCRLFNVCFLESFTRSGGGFETAAVGLRLETHRNEWHRSRTAVKKQEVAATVETALCEQALYVMILRMLQPPHISSGPLVSSSPLSLQKVIVS